MLTPRSLVSAPEFREGGDGVCMLRAARMQPMNPEEMDVLPRTFCRAEFLKEKLLVP